MAITQQSETQWTVDSDSGSQYTVELTGSDRSDPASYKCSCPAGQWGKACKHVKEVIAQAQVEA
jgi:uncharacterized Zn finger protein